MAFLASLLSKGDRVNTPEPGRGWKVATQAKPGKAAGAPRRVVFSC